MLDATLVIVNFDSGDRLARLLDDLAGLAPKIVVLDNASPDESGQAAADRTSIALIEQDANIGFAAGANRAAAEAKEATWLIFINPDAHPTAANLEALLAAPPLGAAAMAPIQTDELGHARSESGGYRPSLLRFAAWAIIPSSIIGRAGPWLAPPFPAEDRDLAWVSGAVLAVRRDMFETIDGFDERYFLYLEDVDLCERITANGGRVILRGGIRVFHEVANGNPRRRAEETSRFVQSLSYRFSGLPRRILGLELTIGFGIRALLGSRPARSGLPAAISLLRGR